ncbi:Retrovirus-related Pol polyprotein from transposon RE2 [Vitis vinifera]|uniref:Retrovirus-related Pol polyprotein from transposon RE2 n=1 Tax=Vitis vinifera TaxID=29760 RepID=A0A438ENR1_VITVI|nr:Retrovirus-related Pol polyprotein from transposon RE2 [Vitis vinifera]
MTVFHSGHLPHLLRLSGQPYCHQKTLTAGDFFRRSPFPTSTIPSGYEDHLVTQEADILEAKGLYTNDIQPLYKVASSIVNVRQQDMDLSTYFGQIVSLKEELLTVMPLTTDVGDQQTQIDKFFMVLMLIGLRPDLETIHNQILDSSSISSLDDVFARLLLITEVNVLITPIAISLATLVINVISYMGGLPALPTWPSHLILKPPQPPSSSTSQGISLTDSEYDDYLLYQATKSASVISIAQTGNASACLTHTSFLGPWILDSGASDHISSNKDLFSSLTTISALPTVTLANGSQTVAKDIGLAHPLPSLPLTSVLYTPECSFNLISISKITRTLNCSITFSDKFMTLQDRSTGKTIGIGRESQGLYHLTSPSTPAVCISTDAPLLIHNHLGHPSLSKFQKMVPRFSSLSSLACESCQLGKHTHVSFPKRLNNRAKSPFELVHTDVRVLVGPHKLSAKATKCIFLGYSRLQKGYRCYSSETHRYFLSADVTFFEDSPFFSTFESLSVSEVLLLSIIFPPDAVPSRPLHVYHCRHHVVVPPSLAEAPADSLPIPLASPAPALPPSADFPIALQKGLRQTMVDEMTALHSNDTWDLVVLPSGKFTVGCHWVYTVKVDLDDIKNAFLHGDLAEEVYMEQPPGFVAQGESSLVCSTANHSVFYHHNSSRQCIYLVVYVDDIVITGSDQNGIQKLKQHLFTHFQTKDLGKLKYFLGIEIAQSNSGVVLSQMKYVLGILEETGMLDCKPVDTPMDPNVKLIPGQGEPLEDPGRYRRLVGKLNYLTITRPDISFPVSVVSQFLQSPCDSHWDVVIRILRYIKSTPSQGVLYENRGHTQVVGYTDADWAGSPR